MKGSNSNKMKEKKRTTFESACVCLCSTRNAVHEYIEWWRTVHKSTLVLDNLCGDYNAFAVIS